jgi:hypothetical protein
MQWIDGALKLLVQSNVADDSDKFWVEIHHSGMLIGRGKHRVYADEKVTVFDNLSG